MAAPPPHGGRSKAAGGVVRCGAAGHRHALPREALRHRKSHLKPVRCCLTSSSAPTLPVSAPAGAPDSASWCFHGPSPADDCSLRRLSLADLAAATGGFSPDNIIGYGSFGFIYRAVLPAAPSSPSCASRPTTPQAASAKASSLSSWSLLPDPDSTSMHNEPPRMNPGAGSRRSCSMNQGDVSSSSHLYTSPA